MKSKVNKETDKLFIEALSTLMYSWGGDTPPEAYWTKDELFEFRAKLDDVSVEDIMNYLCSEFPTEEETIRDEESI